MQKNYSFLVAIKLTVKIDFFQSKPLNFKNLTHAPSSEDENNKLTNFVP